MSMLRRCVLLAALLTAFSAGFAGADTISLGPGGYITITGNDGGPLLLVGNDGFTFYASAGSQGVQALAMCTPGCKGGTTVTLAANFSGGNDTVGMATLHGYTYRCVGCVSSVTNEVSLNTSGSVVLPPVSGQTATVSAPFTVSGTFHHESAPAGSESLSGSGTAVLTLKQLDAYPGYWAISEITYQISSSLPAGWAAVDVGHVGQPGSTTYDNGTFTVAGSGADIWGAADAFQFAVHPMTGDGAIMARVLTEQNTSPYAKAGLMLRDLFDAGAAHVVIDAKPDGSIEFMTRSSDGADTTYLGGATASLPVWLRLTRAGSSIVGAYSSDGVTWTDVGTTGAMAPPTVQTLLAGLIVTSHDNTTVNTSLFDRVNVTSSGPAPVPAPWNSADIGNTGLAGSASYASGRFQVAGAGADIWGNADAFRFVWRPVGGGDASIVTRVTSEDATNPYAKAGVMLRASQNADAANVILDVRPNGSVEFMSRATNGGQTTYLAGASTSVPVWLKLQRVGNQVTGYTSPDFTTWSQVGVAVLQADFSHALLGLAVTSHDTARLNTAIFDNTAVTLSDSTSGAALDRSDWTATATEAAQGDPPASALDGNLNTRFSTGTAQHDSQGFFVSWSGDRTIARIRMDVGPSSNDYPRTCGIWVKDSAGTVTFVNCTPDANGNVDVSFAPIAASRIEVWQWGSAASWWSIAEFNAFRP